MNIAIDGPAGAGKSTIARLVANRLGFLYVDTGAMYRAIALYILDSHVDPENADALNTALDQIHIDIVYENGVQHVLLNLQDVSAEIRSPKVSMMASTTSAIPAVRAKLLDLQRNLAAKNDVLMDGRDIGTNILPNAELKIFLTASVEVRAKRRFDEMVQRGERLDIEDVKADIQQRDTQDMNRAVAPLKQAEDAVFIDSSCMTIEEVVKEIMTLAEKVKQENA